ncbi:MAG: ATP-binding protein, partial [Deltaproteobacteria bacterium]|nr:ATP-binding protein [Deltaproteobacteria bacterium]
NRMVDSLEKGQARLNQQSEELRKTKEALENIFQSSVDAIVAIDHKGYITFANRSMGEIASGKPGEVENLIGVRMSDLYSGGLPEARKIMNTLREKGRLVNYETTMVRNGRVFPILTSASLLKDEKGSVVGTLTSILTFANLLREESSSADSKESLDIVIKEANRAKRIVYDLLSFSREAKPALEWIDLNDVLNVSLLLLEKQGALEGIEVHLDLARELPLVRADSGQMHPVFTNMILNAIQAMNVPNVRGQAVPARERRLSLRTHFYAAPEESLVPPSSLSGPFIRIVIGDTGCGISPENMTRIFDPFFTTKATGKGTGLGLYIVSNILKYYGAQSRLESTEGQGTTFTIDFPLSGGEKL